MRTCVEHPVNIWYNVRMSYEYPENMRTPPQQRATAQLKPCLILTFSFFFSAGRFHSQVGGKGRKITVSIKACRSIQWTEKNTKTCTRCDPNRLELWEELINSQQNIHMKIRGSKSK